MKSGTYVPCQGGTSSPQFSLCETSCHWGVIPANETNQVSVHPQLPMLQFRGIRSSSNALHGACSCSAVAFLPHLPRLQAEGIPTPSCLPRARRSRGLLPWKLLRG